MPEHTRGPWGPMGNPNSTKEELWTPSKGAMEPAPGLTIGSPHNAEPICRVLGYLQPVILNAHVIVASPEMVKVLELVARWTGCPPGMKHIVKAVLAKAKGEPVPAS